MHRAIDPVGEARNDFDIFRALAARLGFEETFTESRDEMGWCQLGLRPGARQRERQGHRSCPASSSSGPKASSSCRRPTATTCCSRISAAIRSAIRLKTPSGRIEIFSEDGRRLRLRRLPAAPGLDAAGGMARQRERRALPLHLVTHQPASRLHSQMDPGPVSRASKVAGREPVRINPADAARRGIGDGDVVRVFNARGACLAGAVLDDGVMPGVVVMATGAWFDPADAAGEPERTAIPTCSRSTSAPRRSPRAPARSPRWSRSSAGRAGAGGARVHAAALGGGLARIGVARTPRRRGEAF